MSRVAHGEVARSVGPKNEHFTLSFSSSIGREMISRTRAKRIFFRVEKCLLRLDYNLSVFFGKENVRAYAKRLWRGKRV